MYMNIVLEKEKAKKNYRFKTYRYKQAFDFLYSPGQLDLRPVLSIFNCE